MINGFKIKLRYSSRHAFVCKGAQWLGSRVLDPEGPRVRVSPASLRCVLEQDTLIPA